MPQPRRRSSSRDRRRSSSPGRSRTRSPSTRRRGRSASPGRVKAKKEEYKRLTTKYNQLKKDYYKIKSTSALQKLRKEFATVKKLLRDQDDDDYYQWYYPQRRYRYYYPQLSSRSSTSTTPSSQQPGSWGGQGATVQNVDLTLKDQWASIQDLCRYFNYTYLATDSPCTNLINAAVTSTVTLYIFKSNTSNNYLSQNVKLSPDMRCNQWFDVTGVINERSGQSAVCIFQTNDGKYQALSFDSTVTRTLSDLPDIMHYLQGTREICGTVRARPSQSGV